MMPPYSEAGRRKGKETVDSVGMLLDRKEAVKRRKFLLEVEEYSVPEADAPTVKIYPVPGETSFSL